MTAVSTNLNIVSKVKYNTKMHIILYVNLESNNIINANKHVY